MGIQRHTAIYSLYSGSPSCGDTHSNDNYYSTPPTIPAASAATTTSTTTTYTVGITTTLLKLD